MKNLYNYFRKQGSKIHLYSKIYTDCIWINEFLKKNSINTVLDVGANKGQYALSLRRFGYKKKIISFEPGLKAYSKLLNISKKDKRWKVYERIGLGDKKKSIKLNISKNSVSSSFKLMNKVHINNEPTSKDASC